VRVIEGAANTLMLPYSFFIAAAFSHAAEMNKSMTKPNTLVKMWFFCFINICLNVKFLLFAVGNQLSSVVFLMPSLRAERSNSKASKLFFDNRFGFRS
jgi:hypothetical protein